MTGDPRIRERIRAVLSDPMLDEATMLDQVNAILDSAPPAPRVFFPGDSVPADTGVMDETGGGGRRFGWDWVADYVYVECWIPNRAEWQSAVDRACDEREEALHSDRHAEITEAEASEARDG